MIKSKWAPNVKFFFILMGIFVSYLIIISFYNFIHHPKVELACKELCGENEILKCQSNAHRFLYPNYVDVSVMCANKDNKMVRIIK